ncbi:hypothetical protein BK742_11750 [Bacillus thuringiensis serovar pingluonsis]|uniref:Group-specific protein n=3 Tax=Bacillus TaxID=1386 RepID=A0A243BH86_BACTU|nr:hypothetical protein bthur0007_8700 [Bacillus thuringiensis serovar monterrey BGSC 4AJ1]OTW53559.1 hypothetical protein BK699_05120 [Bacillus thuringiensis serovar mexicanensis]OTX13079.1 hypothetical protein BK705_01110 [Bacillus thuringiensis serovar monterrey]OTX29878.1 hypothetical protein BK720_21100 [Bacillus thuringiensis serovar brasilensis]OTY45764.1 hypothetical protein BK742_11750 [Bacillus thuringiensis serovar pingluonsis]
MEMENYYMILGISYFNIFCIVVIILFFFIFWRLHVWYNKKHNVPKVFQWFPRKWGKRKVSEHLSQLNEKLAAEGKGIWVTIYAIDLYIVTIPCTVKKYKS